MADLWAEMDGLGERDFLDRMRTLVQERPADDPAALFEMASAYDSTGRTDLAVPLYQQALGAGLDPGRRRRAVIQMASSLRVLGSAEQASDLLRAESGAASDELDSAVVAFLALSLADLGREREALALSLEALAPTLPRYQRALTDYARELGRATA